MAITLLHWVLLLVALQRLAELAVATRNTRKLKARGGIEVGDGHYPLIVGLHAAWLASLLIFVPAGMQPDFLLLGVFGLLQAARIWVIVSLGPFWTTRVITLPGAPLIRRGPYRLLRHPNYVVVAAEIAVLPLAFHAWPVAVVFSILNATVLFWRIRIEEAALEARRQA
jgi:methyltransferase